MKIDTDPKKIDEFLTRGVENIYPSKEFVSKLLSSGKKLRVYMGVDPTGPTLHIGHAIPLKKLGELQKLGHEIIFLIGDFTATVGDPDKMSLRKTLSRKEVMKNARDYRKQASRFIRFGWAGAKIKYNSRWLSRISFEKLLQLSSRLTQAQIIKRAMFQERIKQDKDIHLNEFLYPLMQGYDSVVMGVDGEIGGNDQVFNMLIGRDLMKKISNKEKFVIGTKLLVDPTGTKMGKTAGNMISLNDDHFQMFGKIMGWPDSLILSGLELCTDLPMSEIEEIKTNLEKGFNPRDAKVRLAKEIVKIYHGEESAKRAEKNFEQTFKDGGVPEKIDETVAANGDLLSEVALAAGLVKSKAEFRRLVLEGAVANQETGDKISDPNHKVIGTAIFKIGKRRFLKVKVK